MEDIVAARIIIEERGVPTATATTNSTETNTILGDILRMMNKNSVFGVSGIGMGGAGAAAGEGGIAGIAATVSGVITALGLGGLLTWFNDGSTNPDFVREPSNSEEDAKSTYDWLNDHMPDWLRNFGGQRPGYDGGFTPADGGYTPAGGQNFSELNYTPAPRGAMDRSNEYEQQLYEILKNGVESQDEFNQLLQEREKVEQDITALNQNNEQLSQSELDARSRMLDTLMELNNVIGFYKQQHKDTAMAIQEENQALAQQASLLREIARARSERSAGRNYSSGSVSYNVGGNEYNGHVITDNAFNGGNPTFIGVRTVA